MQPYSPLGSPGTFEAGTPNPLEDDVIKQIAVKHNATPAHVRNEGLMGVVHEQFFIWPHLYLIKFLYAFVLKFELQETLWAFY